MEIKFWDYRFEEYDELGVYFVRDKEVFEQVGVDYYGHDTIALRTSIEPHFYKNGERIA